MAYQFVRYLGNTAINWHQVAIWHDDELDTWIASHERNGNQSGHWRGFPDADEFENWIRSLQAPYGGPQQCTGAQLVNQAITDLLD